MTKKFLCLFLSLLLVLSLCSCMDDDETYISGVSFDMSEYDTNSYSRYENRFYGIIIEYPESYQRIGNFDLDGYVTFEGNGNILSIYVPDEENIEVPSAEEYVKTVLNLPCGEGSGTARYGKCSGYKVVSRNGGRITIDFIIKGAKFFYRFGYSTQEEGFSEEKDPFFSIMDSLRVDDGVFDSLARMSSRYSVLLEYATSMQYITDANYADHCLDNFDLTSEDRHKTEAVATCQTILEEIEKIFSHKPKENALYTEYWESIAEEAENVIGTCEKAKAAIESNDFETAKKILRSEFSYALSENCSKFLNVINTEVSEY